MTMMKTEVTELSEGIHHDLPFDDYRAIDAANKSSLDDIIDLSPMHADYNRRNPKADSPALLIGRALHCLLLESETYDSQFVVAPKCAAVKKDGDACGNNAVGQDPSGCWVCGVHAKGKGCDTPMGISLLTTEQAGAVVGMRDAILRNHVARKFIEDIGEGDANELSAVWTDKETGLRCKGRFDMGRWMNWEAVGDIKTTQCASLIEFERSLTTFKYHRQAAFYQDGAAALGVPFKHFPIIAVEKEPPHGVGIFRLKDLDIEAGREEIRRGLRLWAECKQRDRWPGYTSEFQDIGITQYAMKQIINPRG